MGDKISMRRARGRPIVILLLAAAMLLVLAIAAPSAFAFSSWNTTHPTGCGPCHPNGTAAPGTSAACQTCHTGFQLRSGAPQSCWSCHQPGVSTAPLKQQSSCVGVCHMQVPGNPAYTNDQTPHAAGIHYASGLKNCAVCHGVSVSITNPDGSPHHDTVDMVAPTNDSCTTCHGTPPVDGAKTAHGNLQTGVDPTDCKHCHVGMVSAHPKAVALLKPSVTAVVTTGAGGTTIKGTVKSGTTALANFTGWIQWKTPTDTDWSDTQEAAITTTATGAFTTTIATPVAGTVYRVIFEGATVGAKTYRPTLAPARLKSTLSLALVGPKSGILRLGKTAAAKGILKPARAVKPLVTFQRFVGGKWVKVLAKRAATINATTGAYSGPAYKPTKRGKYRAQATIAATALYTAAKSPWRAFTVK